MCALLNPIHLSDTHHTHARNNTTDNYLNAHMFNCGISNSQSSEQLPAGTHCFGTGWVLCVFVRVCKMPAFSWHPAVHNSLFFYFEHISETVAQCILVTDENKEYVVF